MMKTLLKSLLIFVSLQLGAVWSLAIDPVAQAEIDHLMQVIENPANRYIRNGEEFTAKEGADRMREKMKIAGERIVTAEDFIEEVANTSNQGKQYLLRQPGESDRTVGPWLIEVLAKYRAAQKQGS